MTIDKFYWPLSLGPDRQEDTKLSEAKEFIVRNNEASAPRDEGEFRKRCDSMLGERGIAILVLLLAQQSKEY